MAAQIIRRFRHLSEKQRSLLISLIVAIVGLVSTIYILSLPEYIPGT
ncbi:hypothetical protein SDC49_20145 [Lactobacillus sp. R2/2]|nr:hypothetical protein [Lactobacillus sp. R2/2]